MESVVVLTMPLTEDAQKLVDHPNRFWLTSMDGTTISRFSVAVRNEKARSEEPGQKGGQNVSTTC